MRASGDDPSADGRSAALLATVVRAPLLTSALAGALAPLVAAGDAESTALGVRLFEGVWPLLPPFDDPRVTGLAAELYQRAGETGAALLLRPAAAEDAGAALHPQAAAMLAHTYPDSLLLGVLTALAEARAWSDLAHLFTDIFRRRPALREKWLFHRAADAFAALGEPRCAMLMAGIAVQLDPAVVESDGPYRRLLGWFRDTRGWPREAALLCRRRAALCPQAPLLDDAALAALVAAAGTVPDPPRPPGRRDWQVLPASVRPPLPWRSYGGVHPDLLALAGEMRRDAIRVSELQRATVLVDRGALAIFDAAGAPVADLSPREPPAAVRRRLDGARGVEALWADRAVVLADEYPTENLCHFMFDHAPRLLLYREAGVDLSRAVAIGPQLSKDYQRQIARRLGMPPYIDAMRRARIAVDGLYVTSDCRHVQHAAQRGAAWAVRAVRDRFDAGPRGEPKRLLISRADVTRRQLVNEGELRAMLPGFETIVPTEKTYVEQIAMFRDATHVVGVHGAALTNIAFCAPGTHVLEILPPRYGTAAYALAAQALDLDYAAMIGRDGYSDDPALNDPGLPRARHDEFIDQHVRVVPELVRAWMKDVGL